VKVPSGGAGEHVARRKGGSAEFLEHRAYYPGDDLRRVDWLAYARTGEPVVKLFRAEEDLILRIVIDASASLEGEKLETAKRIAAAMGYVGLAASERVQVFPFADTMRPPSKPVRGRGGLPTLLRTLEGIEASGRTNLGGAIENAIRTGRPGMLIVISDFMDSSGFDRALLAARGAGNDVVLAQVLTRDEIAPSFRGDLMLEDAETGETITLTADVDTIEAYLARLAGLYEMLRRWARTHGGTYVRLATDDKLEDAVRRILDRRIDA
jgi:uncharacterized protein (DUF58 family)